MISECWVRLCVIVFVVSVANQAHQSEILSWTSPIASSHTRTLRTSLQLDGPWTIEHTYLVSYNIFVFRFAALYVSLVVLVLWAMTPSLPLETVRKGVKRRHYDMNTLENDTPSRRAGLSKEKEEEYRQAYTQLIIDVGQKLGLYVRNSCILNIWLIYKLKFSNANAFAFQSRVLFEPLPFAVSCY